MGITGPSKLLPPGSRSQAARPRPTRPTRRSTPHRQTQSSTRGGESRRRRGRCWKEALWCGGSRARGESRRFGEARLVCTPPAEDGTPNRGGLTGRCRRPLGAPAARLGVPHKARRPVRTGRGGEEERERSDGERALLSDSSSNGKSSRSGKPSLPAELPPLVNASECGASLNLAVRASRASGLLPPRLVHHLSLPRPEQG